MPYIEINNLSFYYEIEGKGPSLILVTGYGSDLSSWKKIRAELARHFQLVLFDNRGSGRTSCPANSFTIEDMADDVVKLIDALDLKKPHILGHSMGGAIVQTVAYRHPEKIGKAIFAQSITKTAPATAGALKAQVHLKQDKIPVRRIAEVRLPWLFSDAFLENPDLCEKYIQWQEQLPFPPTLEGLEKQLEALLQFDSRPWYGRISVPSLVLACDEDRLCPAKTLEVMAGKIPHAKFHLIRKSGHAPQIEQSEELCQVVKDFLLLS